MQDYEILLCSKTERVCIFKLPPLSTTKGYFFDDWKEMIWEGGLKLVEKKKALTLTFIDKQGKVFATTPLPANPEEAIVKTMDSSRGYAVRLEKPNGGGYLWVGVAFRDRNDAFDFGVAFRDFNEKKALNSEQLKAQFANQVDFSLKKGEKIKIDIGKSDKPKATKGANDFNLFSFESPPDAGQPGQPTQPKPLKSFQFPGSKPGTKPAQNKPAQNADWLNFDEKPKPKKNDQIDLLDL